MKRATYYLLVSLITISCNNLTTADIPDEHGISLEWEFVGNHAIEGYFSSVFTIKNKSEYVLENRGWALYYNQMGYGIIQESVVGNVRIDFVNGDLVRISPKDDFILKPGKSVEIGYNTPSWLTKENEAPKGAYMVYYDSADHEIATVPIEHLTVKPFTELDNVFRPETSIPHPEASWVFEHNQNQSLLEEEYINLIIPTPVKSTFYDDVIILEEDLMIHHMEGLEKEADYLAGILEQVMGRAPAVMQSNKGGANIIRLSIHKAKALGEEGYQLVCNPKGGIVITGSASKGVFYGIQSLLTMLPVEVWETAQSQIEVSACMIHDKPAFSYRGMHLDIARNYLKPDAIKKLIQVMAFYKMNTLHLHVTDDEGWRLEIPSLPELTEVGGYRGHTADSKDHLIPHYGSGMVADPGSGHGSGFLTREEFIEILRFAADHHVEVIPEINFPGHARSAIYAMEARYDRLVEEGKEEEALEYRLIDPDDESEYTSAQNFHDNVVCVCLEAPYRFYETVLDEIIKMYEEAGLKMRVMHAGGDEVPQGSWTGSPLCAEFLTQHPELSDTENLQAYCEGRLFEILKKRNLVMAGWEEIAMKKNEEGIWIPNPEFVGDQMLPYVWNSIDENLDLGNRLANAGYPVILCNATNFYFDFGYNHHPAEPGHYWGGLVNTRRAFEFIPFNVFRSTVYDRYWRPIDPELFAGMESLKPEAYKNIVGLQGELWSEFIKGGEMLEYFYMPKMLGLVERAWVGQAEWGNIEKKEQRMEAIQLAWNSFANTIGQREMPRLDHLFGGFNYRLPPPGAVIRDGQLLANIDFPGLTIRYTTDGSEPGPESTLYTGPVEVTDQVQLRSFDTRGRGSRISVAGIE